MVSAGRHTLSPVTEESGDELVSPPPVSQAEAPPTRVYETVQNLQLSLNVAGSSGSVFHPGLSTAPLQDLDSLDDLQRSWETLKNVMSEKQRSLYEALEKQQQNQASLQNVSARMEALENKLNQPLENPESPDSHIPDHTGVTAEIQSVQEDLDRLQSSLVKDLSRGPDWDLDSDPDPDSAQCLAVRSSLAVLAERMATIHMKASGRRQLLEERVSERLEDRRQEQNLQLFQNQADQLDQFLTRTRSAAAAVLRPDGADREEQLESCQNLLLDLEQQVAALTQLAAQSDGLLLEGRQDTGDTRDTRDTRDEAQRLSQKLGTLKGGLLELQKMLQDRRSSIQDSLQDPEDSESDSSRSHSPSLQDWLVQARTRRTQQQQDTLQRQRELEEQLEEQKRLLQSVASRGGDALSQRSPPAATRDTESMRQRWDSLRLELKTKLQLLQKTLDQDRDQDRDRDPKQPVFVFHGDTMEETSTMKTLYSNLKQTLEEKTIQAAGSESQVQQVEQQMYRVVSSTSTWLDSVENTVLCGTAVLSEDPETELQKQETLETDVRQLTDEVEQCLVLLASSSSLEQQDRPLLEDSLDCVRDRLTALGGALGRRSERMRSRVQEVTACQTELQLLQTTFIETKCHILQTLAGNMERPASIQLEVICSAEENLKNFELKMTELKNRTTSLQTDQNKLLKLQDSYEELLLTVCSRRSLLNQSMSLKDQYDQTLQDLKDLLDTARDKMAAERTLMVGSLEDVQSQLNRHKEFFQGLESHLVLTETYFRRISGLLLPAESLVLQEAQNQARTLLRQAHSKGVELERLLETWTHLDLDYQTLSQQLDQVEGLVPSPSLVLQEDTEQRLQDRVSVYQDLKDRLWDQQHRLNQVLDQGKVLLRALCCPVLENQLATLGERWTRTSSWINRDLDRLESILRHWSRFHQDSSEISQWLQSALDRLQFWTTEASGPEEPETVQDQLATFLEFSKEVEVKALQKNSVLSEGNLLLRLTAVDSPVLRSDLNQIETQWNRLLAGMPPVQERLHQVQMQKLAWRHAVTELSGWISLVENVSDEDEENLKSSVGSAVIRDYLQKYKGLRVDLGCRQLTVDFVNQAALQVGGRDPEKTALVERLGVVNRAWQSLQGRIQQRVQVLENLLEAWMDYETGVQNLKSWMGTQEERLKTRNRIEDLTSVQNALKDCQDLEQQMKDKEKELENLEEQGCALVQNKTDEACAIVMETLQGVNHSWAHLDHLIRQLKISLTSVLDQWVLYQQVEEEISGFLTEGRYSVSRLRLLTGSLEAVQLQVQSLQDLQEQLQKQDSSLRRFGAVTHQLLKDCPPSVSDCLNNTLKDVNARWAGLQDELDQRVHSSSSLLQMWRRYETLQQQSLQDVQQQEDKAELVLKATGSRDVSDDEASHWIRQCSELLRDQAPVRASLQVLQELGDQLKTQVDTAAASSIQSDRLSLVQRLEATERALDRQLATLQTGVRDYETFNSQLETLSCWTAEAEDVLKRQDPNGTSDPTVLRDHMDQLKRLMLKFSGTVPDLDRLNQLGYQLPLSENQIKNLQNLNRTWTMTSAQTAERFSKLQSVLLQQQSFLEKCETWMDFLVQTEENLAVDISGDVHSLTEQQKAHELFQAEMFSRQQILHSIISDGQRMLEQGQVDDRDEFGLKLALLSSQWQGVVRRAQQRRGIVDGLLRQWQRYGDLMETLRRRLDEASRSCPGPVRVPVPAPVPLQQARCMLDAARLQERALRRQQGGYILAVEAATQLLQSADGRTATVLQQQLTDVQQRWRQTTTRLEGHRRELEALMQDWERCERGITVSLDKLRVFKQQLSHPLPDQQDQLQDELLRCKGLEDSLDGWTDDLSHLTSLRQSLSCFFSSDDVKVLQERTDVLQRQWEEACTQLSLRRQQVSERLNQWTLFFQRYRELCDWLNAMESKVSHNAELSIEDMIQRLRKDYQEEISVSEENKLQLNELGRRLIVSSQQSKAAEIQHKLKNVDERWKHLLELTGARVKKLRETLVAVQQLEKNMGSLRSWLVQMEAELSRPICFQTCNLQEIQDKLQQQEELQRDIEKHSTGVASVLNLCEVLLHDSDACSTDGESESIQQATRSLDRRWRSICAGSMERRLKIEETWRLWQKFLDEFSRFDEWLQVAECTAAAAESSGVLYTAAKEELKKFEVFQRRVLENLTQLELLNKQYRRLARENRTDSDGRLRQTARDANRRWDELQRRTVAVLRRLKHFTGQREDFETSRDGVLVWLTELDLQLTNIEHFSECDVQAKIRQLRAFQQEMSLTAPRIQQVFRQGAALMEKSEPLDGAVLEDELDELQRYRAEVFARVDRYHCKLVRLQLADEDGDMSLSDRDLDRDLDLDEAPLPSSGRSASLVVQLRAERSGRDTPASVDSIPLEWDHDYDLSRGLDRDRDRDQDLSHSLDQDQDADFLQRPPSGLAGDSITGDPGLLSVDGGGGAEPDSSYVGYMRLLGDCRGSIAAVTRMDIQLKEDGDTVSGLADPGSESQTTGVIERWELLQARDLSRDLRTERDRKQLDSDLEGVWTWLGQTGDELDRQRTLELGTDIRTIEQRIKKLKELQKAYDRRKALVLSVNLCSAEFLKDNSPETRRLRSRLKDLNQEWDQTGVRLDDWRTALQGALMQCHDFHETSHGLLLWLENIDRRRNQVLPIDPVQDGDTLQQQHRTLMQIREELLDSQQKVALLQGLSLQLLVDAQTGDCLEAREKVHVIGNRLKLLLKDVTRDLRELARALDLTTSQQDLSSWSSTDDMDSSPSLSPLSGRSSPSRRRSRGKCIVAPTGASETSPAHRCTSVDGPGSSRSDLVRRVLLVSVPLQLCLALLLLLALLLPPSRDDCPVQSNRLSPSLYPTLQYPHGPPPV